MTMENRVFIAGAGPVGLVAAAQLVRRGIPVRVFEASPALSEESRASTFHSPTLDILDDLGVAADLIAQGLIAPRFQYRTKQDGIIGAFDFSALADVTRHPYRLQAEQFKLTRIILAKLRTIRTSALCSAAVSAASRRTVTASPCNWHHRTARLKSIAAAG